MKNTKKYTKKPAVLISNKTNPKIKKIGLFISIGLVLIYIFFIILSFNKKEKSFTFIVLPDTQKYAMNDPEIFNKQTEWIVKNKNSLNIKFVSHLGDIVQGGGWDNNEWKIASGAMLLLEKASIPYSIIPGNHDVDKVDEPNAGFTKYNEIFTLSRFENKPWFGGNFHEYQNSYSLIQVDKTPFIILNLEVDPADDVLQWANTVLTKNKNRRAIVTTHAYLQDSDPKRSQAPHFRKNGNSGEEIWNKLVKNNCNVFLVLSGHFHQDDGENQLTSTNNCDRAVYQIVQDYQGRKNGGEGLLRIYQFYPLIKKIKVFTYSPTKNNYERDKDSQFILSWPN